MKTARTALAALMLLGSAAGLSASAKSPPPSLQLHSYILLDRTGSMQSRWEETLSSVNAYASSLADGDGPKVNADITLAVFDAQDGLKFDVIRDDVEASRWKKVTDADATPRGMTPLYDAIGRMVALAEHDNPKTAVIVIVTDGEENSSHEITKAGAKAALDRVRAKGWQVVFLGAEFSNFSDAQGVGQSASRNMAVTKDQMSDSMSRLAQKSKSFAAGAAPTVEWNAEDRKAAKEDDVKKQQGVN